MAQAGLINRGYDKWIENILSDGVWQPWQAEKDRRYQAFQRDLFLSESLLDKGYLAEGLAYIKKASFSLQDIHQSLRRIHNWPERLENEFKIGNSDDEKRALALRMNHKIHAIHLYLQYEQYYFHSQTFSKEQQSYIKKAEGLYRSLKESKLKNKINKSYLGLYLRNLGKFSSDFEKIILEVEKFTLNKTFGNDYWYHKLVKRIIFLATAWGYPEKAISLLNHLQKRKAFDLPTISKYQIYLAAGETKNAINVILKEVFSFDLSKPFVWPEYIDLKMHYIHGLIIEENHEGALAKAEALNNEINAHMRKNLVSQDQEDFFKDRQLTLFILSQALRHNLNKPLGQTSLNLTDWPEQYNKTLYRYYALNALLGKSEKVSKSKAAATLIFQQKAIAAFRSGNEKGIRLNLAKLAEQDNHHAKNAAALLEYTLGLDTSVASWQKAYKSFLLLSPYGFSSHTLPINEFDVAVLEKVLKKKKSPEIFSMLAFASLWHSILHSRDAFLFNSLNRVRYLNLVHNDFIQPIVNVTHLYSWFENQFTANMALVKNKCQGDNACFHIYPSQDKTYVSWQYKNKLNEIELEHTNADLKNQSVAFFQSFEKGQAYAPYLSNLNQTFSPILTQISKSQAKVIQLFAYRNATFIPFEALDLGNNQRMADRFLLKRKLQTDFVLAPTQVSSRQAGKLFFLGIGKGGGGFLGLSAAQDELDDIEGVFANKKIIRSESEYLEEFLKAINKATNTVCHFASEWLPDDNQNGEAYLKLGEGASQMHLNQLSRVKKLPRIIISKQRLLPFAQSKSLHFKRMLNAFKMKGTEVLILTTVETPKKFRSAFYYDFYYRLERKNANLFDAYRGAFFRTKKGFARDLWPYLVTIYEP